MPKSYRNTESGIATKKPYNSNTIHNINNNIIEDKDRKIERQREEYKLK